MLNKLDNTLKIPKLRTRIFTLSNSTENFTKLAEMSVSEGELFVRVKPATHLAILYAHRGEFDRQRFSLAIDADTPGDFFRRSRR